MEKIIVIGGGGHAKVVIAVLKNLSSFEVLGYLDAQDHGTVLGVAYLGTDESLPSIKQQYPACVAVIGVGSVDCSGHRRKIMDRLVQEGFSLPAIAAASAVIQDAVTLGDGVVVMDGAVINAGSRIGAGAIINTGSSIDHDCLIGDFVHVAPGATICGEVRVGNNTLIGAGATIIQHITIAGDCLIAAGSTVVEDLSTGRYAGTPARRIP